MGIYAIVAVDNNWGIGKNGNLLFDIPEDKKFFKRMTENQVVIMGRKTWDSLPIKPLKNRYNTVITRQTRQLDEEDYGFVHMQEVISAIQIINQDEYKDIYVIGGGQIYKELLPYCQKVYVTKIFSSKSADTFFPNLDISDEWFINKESDLYEYNGIQYRFLEYIRGN